MTAPSRRDRAAVGLLVALVLLLPVATAKVVFTTPSAVDDLLRRTALHVFDPVLLAILAVALSRWRDAGWARPTGTVARLGAAIAALFLLSFGLHPSTHGLEVLLRIVTAVAVATELRRLRGRERQLVLGAVFAVGVGQAGLALLQVRNGGTLTHGPLEMSRFVLYRFGGSVAGQGSFSHPYHLACFLSVALAAGLAGLRAAPAGRRGWWYAGLPWLGAALGMSFSRMCLVAVALALGVVVLGRRGAERRLATVAAALVAVGFLAGGYAGLEGWRYKGAVTADASEFDSSRSTLAQVARHVIAENPVLGVGPGRYVQAVIDERGSSYHLPPHDLLLQVGAEEGVLAAALVALVAVAVARRALRGGPEALAALVLVAPFFLFDAFPYDYPPGFAIAGVWLGVLHLVPDEGEPRPSSPESAESLVGA